MPEIDKLDLSKLSTSELEALQEQVMSTLGQRYRQQNQAERKRKIRDLQIPLLQREDTDLSPESLNKKRVLLHLQTLLKDSENGWFQLRSLDNPLVKRFYDYLNFVFGQIKVPGIYISRHELMQNQTLTISDYTYQWQDGKQSDRFETIFFVRPEDPLTINPENISALLFMPPGKRRMQISFRISSQILSCRYRRLTEFDFSLPLLDPNIVHSELDERIQIP